MKCKNIEIQLSDLIDGKLNEARQKEVNDHLERCPSCRVKLNKLQNYKLVVSKIENQDVPDNLRSSIWKSIENDKKEGVSVKSRTIKPAQGISIATLAAAILLLILIKPFSPGLISIDTSYSFVVEKKGKGPSVERVYEKGSDPRVDRILAIADSAGIDDTKPIINKATSQVEGIGLRITTEKYPGFRELFNSERGALPLPALPLDYRRKYIRLQVYIPGRKFFTGDFDGDSHDDFGIYFNRGKYTGKIFISTNDKSGNFNGYVPALLDEKISFKPGDNVIPGDYNGDGLDDLLIRYANSPEPGDLCFYLNKGHNEFYRDNILSVEESPYISNNWMKVLSGDFDGDDLDDIAVVHYRGEHKGRFIIYLNKRNQGFGSPYFFDASFEGMEDDNKFTPLVMDINGDGYSDPGIYWQSGDRDAFWYFSINNRNGTGGKEFHAGFGKGYRAYMGNYLAFTGDTNGDGYDELLIKLGTADEIAQWYLMHNRQDSTFALGQNILFDGESELIIR